MSDFKIMFDLVVILSIAAFVIINNHDKKKKHNRINNASHSNIDFDFDDNMSTTKDEVEKIKKDKNLLEKKRFMSEMEKELNNSKINYLQQLPILIISCISFFTALLALVIGTFLEDSSLKYIFGGIVMTFIFAGVCYTEKKGLSFNQRKNNKDIEDLIYKNGKLEMKIQEIDKFLSKIPD